MPQYLVEVVKPAGRASRRQQIRPITGQGEV
jgi:hypothetical protein